MKTKIIVGAVVLVAVVWLGVSFPKGNPVINVGGSGQTQTSRVFFQDNVVIGGGSLATTSQGTVTYTVKNIMNSIVIEHIATAATTATLPTGASLLAAGFLQNPGDTQTLFIHASTTGITLAGNTGTDLNSASSTKFMIAGSVTRLDFVRLGATESNLYQVLMIPAAE